MFSSQHNVPPAPKLSAAASSHKNVSPLCLAEKPALTSSMTIISLGQPTLNIPRSLSTFFSGAEQSPTSLQQTAPEDKTAGLTP